MNGTGIMNRCKAKTKQTGKRCKRSPTPGREVCRLHGGATPRGIDSPHFKHGRYSKAMPDRLIEKYETARNDPDLITMRDDIALIDTRIMDQLELAEADPVIWDVITDLIEKRRKLCESERRRLYDLQTTMTAEQAMAMITALIAIIRSHIGDQDRRRAIVRDIRDLLQKQKVVQAPVIISTTPVEETVVRVIYDDPIGNSRYLPPGEKLP